MMRERRRRGRRHLCILNRGVERETGYLPPRAKAGCDAFTRAESVRLDAFTFISLESLSIDRIVWVWRRKEDVRQRSVTRRGGQILVHFYDTSAFFFLRKQRVLFLDYSHQIIRKRNRLVSMPPVKPPSYTNLSSGKS